MAIKRTRARTKRAAASRKRSSQRLTVASAPQPVAPRAIRTLDELPEREQLMLWVALREFDPDATLASDLAAWARDLEQQAHRARDRVFREAARGATEVRYVRLGDLGDPASVYAAGRAGGEPSSLEHAAQQGDELAVLLIEVGAVLALRPAEPAMLNARTIWSEICDEITLGHPFAEGFAVAPRPATHAQLLDLAIELLGAAWRIGKANAKPARGRGRPKADATRSLCRLAHRAGLNAGALARDAVRFPGPYVERLLRAEGAPTRGEWASATTPRQCTALSKRASDAQRIVAEQLRNNFRQRWPVQ